MLMLLSPAKSLDYETPPAVSRHTLPQFVEQSAALIEVIKPYTPAQISSLMDLSDALSQLMARGRPNSVPRTASRPCWPSMAMSTKAWTPNP